jgi:hypothetical protein
MLKTQVDKVSDIGEAFSTLEVYSLRDEDCATDRSIAVNVITEKEVSKVRKPLTSCS